MKGKDLLRALSNVDDRFISEAEEKKHGKSVIKFALPIAACFALVFAVVLSMLNFQNMFLQSGVAHSGTAYENKYTLYFNKVVGINVSEIDIKGHFWKELTQEQKEKLLPGIAEKYQIDGTVHYSHAEGVTSVFEVYTVIKADGKNIKITIAQGEVAKDCIVSGKPIFSEIEGVNVEAGIFVTDKNSKGERNYIYYADFSIDDIAYHVEYSGEKNDNDYFASVIADIILGGKADFSILDNPTVPELRDDDLTEKEAYNETDFGAYLPKVPNGYQFNSAKRFINQESNYLSASWSREYDDVRFSISKINEQDRKRIVSGKDIELYDMSLYPIPWADSMPEDKREIIENPIFRIEDLTIDVVKKREYISGEQGDPSGKSTNMRFSVLYGDILVEVSTEGVSAEYLFHELSSITK